MNDTPDFRSWERSTLDRFANEAYKRMQEQQDVIEQLRQDNKDLCKINRELLKGTQDDWK